MADGSDAIADWPLLNALVNTASGASWVSIHHGGGVGMGRSIHAGRVTVADGTALAAEKLERVLINDPGMGVIRHVDAGYEYAASGRRAQGPHSDEGPAVNFDSLWPSLRDVGRDARSGGYRRFAWTAVDLTLREWFTGEAQRRGMSLEEDRNGNLWAWWLPPGYVDDPRDAFVTGSHLDSVPDGGPFDGPLGIVSAFSAIDLLRTDGVTPRVPVGVVAFSDEEGARFGVACVGSQLSTGALHPERAESARRRRHDTGRRVAKGGTPPRTPGCRPGAGRTGGVYVELHVEQGRALDLVDRPSPSHRPSGRTAAGGSPSAVRPTTPAPPDFEDRRDPMLTFATAVRRPRPRGRARCGRDVRQ